jgi:hypothetical protein
MARNDQQLAEMGMEALMKAGEQMGSKPRLFNPKSKGKKKLSRQFDAAKKGKKIPKIKGYKFAGEVDPEHPSKWYSKGK